VARSAQKDDPLLPKRKLILERNALEQSGVVRLDGEIPPRFFHALRARELSAEGKCTASCASRPSC
jgi:hypothetical protein